MSDNERSLFPPRPLPRLVDLRRCDVADLLPTVRGASLIHADPPWVYKNAGTRGNAADEYALLDMPGIVEHLAAARASAARDCRLVVWCTWPMVGEWFERTAGWTWGRPVTGGSWHKEGAPGVGFHWRGNSELVLVYRVGRPRTAKREMLLNAHSSRRGRHSEKPAPWLAAMLRRWTEPGDLVLDLYAGMAPMAHACHAEGRRYVGAEIDADRYALACEGLPGGDDAA